jgi:hypothetical protein
MQLFVKSQKKIREVGAAASDDDTVFCFVLGASGYDSPQFTDYYM